jgi:general secretion pathway protein C
MSTHSPRPWALYLVTFLAALLAAASAAYWVLGVAGVAGQRTQAASVLTGPAAPDAKDLARALGGDLALQTKPVETTSTQYQLLGVVAGPVGKGYALLVVGGAPPKTYTVGSAIGEGQVLQSVSARGAKIGSALQGPATVELSLPKPPGA